MKYTIILYHYLFLFNQQIFHGYWMLGQFL